MRPFVRLMNILGMDAMLLMALYNYANDKMILMTACLFMAGANCIMAII